MLDRELTLIEADYSRIISKGADDVMLVIRKSQEEQKLWRQYRVAHCTLYGFTEGGSESWKSAFAGMCQLDDTQKRIARLKKEIGVRN